VGRAGDQEARDSSEAVDNIILIVAFLVFSLRLALPLSPTGERVTLLAAIAIMVGGFLKFIWDAKPWR